MTISPSCTVLYFAVCRLPPPLDVLDFRALAVRGTAWARGLLSYIGVHGGMNNEPGRMVGATLTDAFEICLGRSIFSWHCCTIGSTRHG